MSTLSVTKITYRIGIWIGPFGRPELIRDHIIYYKSGKSHKTGHAHKEITANTASKIATALFAAKDRLDITYRPHLGRYIGWAASWTRIKE